MFVRFQNAMIRRKNSFFFHYKKKGGKDEGTAY